jgi:ketosteroid isomerase-like protein
MSNHRNRMMKRIAMLLLLSSTTCFAQTAKIEPASRKGIDARNQAWVDGMKAGEAAPIIATYSDNALDCSPTGECASGRAAIEQNIQKLLAKWGRAQRAQVNSMGSVQQGDFVYEWGRAEASFASGNNVVDRYLTVWHREADGSWKIFRNMVIPDDERH